MEEMITGVFVSYRSGPAAVRAIESFRRSASAAGIAAEAVAVVNSGDPSEAAILRDAADRTLLAERNLGFAGGLNRGLVEARGDVLALANPDVVFGEPAVGLLFEAARREPLVACGPALFLDEGETLLLPAPEEPRPAELLRRALEADPQSAPRLFARELRRAQRLWAASRALATLPASGLSGALVVAARETLESVGPFDEGYPLYYEENDWQHRLRLAGGRLRRVLGARVVHRYNQSAKSEPRAAAWFAASERRYFASHFGERGESAMARLAQANAVRPVRSVPPACEELRIPPAPPVAVAFSPLPTLRPFAYTELPEGITSWRPPEDVRAGMSGVWYARALVLRTGEVLAEGAIASLSASP